MDLSSQALKKLQRELAYLRTENAYLKKLEKLLRQKRRWQKYLVPRFIIKHILCITIKNELN